MDYCTDFISEERQRIRAEYQRREREVQLDRYAPWQPAEILMREERKRVAARMLHREGVFPRPGDSCLEVGFGSLGWLGDLITWGTREQNLHGIELDPDRAQKAQEALPMADLRVGDATKLPWDEGFFHLVIASTVFTSVLNREVRRLMAAEITRVMRPGGTLLWYDFAINNPKNPNVRRVGRKELRRLFPQLNGRVKSVGLAPPLARLVAPANWTMAVFLEGVPLLRTHLLAVLVK
jgi:ubiquinone/menaquinone biosynthesis C-methylase UbiE